MLKPPKVIKPKALIPSCQDHPRVPYQKPSMSPTRGPIRKFYRKSDSISLVNGTPPNVLCIENSFKKNAFTLFHPLYNKFSQNLQDFNNNSIGI